jgi:hypothetical protein
MMIFLVALICVFATASWAASELEAYYAHPRQEDADGVIAPWHKGQNGPLDERLRIAIDVCKRYPWVLTDKAVMAAPDFVYNSHWRITDDGEIQIPPTTDWMCGDLSQRAWSTIKGLADYYRYCGDPIAFLYITRTVDYLLDYAQTAADHSWPRFPISTPTKGKVYGVCDPTGRIQLDLCARLGEDVLTAYKLTGNERYLEAVKHWADVFAEKCNFDPEFSPWNRYVDPSVVDWSDKLTGSVTMILEFLDEVIATGYAGTDNAILRARDAGRTYLRDNLLPRWQANEVWGRQYWDWDNPVMCGIVSMCADYMLKHRDAFPNWKNDLRNMLTLVFSRNGVDPNSMGDTYSGAWAFPESCTCCGTSLSYNQYTASPTILRYAFYAGDDRMREIGRRMIIMATYDADENGVVKDGLLGQQVATGEWSNLAHPWPLCQVLEAMKWTPEVFGPARENHVMSTTSVVNWVVYEKGRIEYTAFDAPPETVDVLRLAFLPTRILAGNKPLDELPVLDGNGFATQALPCGDYIVKVRHDAETRVTVLGNDAQESIRAAEIEHGNAWEVKEDGNASGGSLLETAGAGARLRVPFDGNQVRVVGRVDGKGGIADVFLDGVQQKTLIDFWCPTARDKQTVYSHSGLVSGSHVLEIVARGAGNPISSGKTVCIDSVQYSAATSEPSFGAGGGPTGPQRMIFGYMGRKDYVDSHGNAWRPGTEFIIRAGYGKDSVAEALWTERRTMYIGNTPDEELFRYGAHGREFWVNLTVGPGAYSLKLMFASTPLHPFLEQDKDKGWVRHVLNVDINKERVVTALDVAEAAGGRFKALERTFENIKPRNGIIEVKLTGCDGREAILQALELAPMPRAS